MKWWIDDEMRISNFSATILNENEKRTPLLPVDMINAVVCFRELIKITFKKELNANNFLCLLPFDFQKTAFLSTTCGSHDD
jgi:hypothetical protein